MPIDKCQSSRSTHAVSRGKALAVMAALLLAACAADDPANDRRERRERRTRDADVDARDAARDAADTDSGEDAGQPLDVAPADTGADATGSDTRASDASDRDVQPGPGTPLGTFWNTYYYLAVESAHDTADDTTLLDANCDPIAEVPAAFARDACIEGSARLEDGTVVNYDEPCSCGPCSFCWAEMDPQQFPWGMGSRGNALEPLRSWAIDNDVLTQGSWYYVEEFDGLQIPQVGGLGGFVHDGCFRADDVGGGIDGNHFDFFAGTPAMWQALEGIYPTRTDFVVHGDSPRCEHLH